MGLFLGSFLGHFWTLPGTPRRGPRAARARGRPGPRGPGGAPGRPGAPPARAGNLGHFWGRFSGPIYIVSLLQGVFLGVPGAPRGGPPARPPRPPGGQKSVHFFGYLITLPVGTVWDTFSTRDILGQSILGPILGPFLGVFLGSFLRLSGAPSKGRQNLGRIRESGKRRDPLCGLTRNGGYVRDGLSSLASTAVRAAS